MKNGQGLIVLGVVLYCLHVIFSQSSPFGSSFLGNSGKGGVQQLYINASTSDERTPAGEAPRGCQKTISQLEATIDAREKLRINFQCESHLIGSQHSYLREVTLIHPSQIRCTKDEHAAAHNAISIRCRNLSKKRKIRMQKVSALCCTQDQGVPVLAQR